MTPAEIDRSEAHRAAVMVWAARIPAVLASPTAARRLALGIVDGLLCTFAWGERSAFVSPVFRDGMTRVREVFDRANAAQDPCDHRGEADRLGSLLYPRTAPRWTWEVRVPYEVAEALRRACEDEALLCVGTCPTFCSACGGPTDGDESRPTRCCRSLHRRLSAPVAPPILALLLHDAHALLTDLHAPTDGLDALVAEAEARERETPTARPARHETRSKMRREGREER